MFFGIFFNDISNFFIHDIRFANGNGFFKSSVCVFNLCISIFNFRLTISEFYQEFRVIIDFTNTESFIKIGMHSFVVDTDIQIDNIAFFERSVIRDTMANDFIDRSRQLINISQIC